MKRIFNLLNRHKSLISYAFFGVCTTAANVITYDIFYNKLQVPNIIATIIAWFVAVIFAFITNKLFVFGSFDLHPKKVCSEFVPFVACRAATGVFTMVAMIAMVDGMGIKQDFICKIVVSAISLVLNYIFSKWFIFKKKES